MNPTILGVIGPGFLNQVPTLQRKPAAPENCVLRRVLQISCGLGFRVLAQTSFCRDASDLSIEERDSHVF